MACMPSKLSVKRLGEKQLSDDIIFWNIYQEAFPEDQKEDRKIILSTIAKRHGFVLKACYCHEKYKNKHTVGLAIIHKILKPDMNYLCYLAVSRSVRGHGIGTQLLDEIDRIRILNIKLWRRKKYVVAEVEDPDITEDSLERSIRKRRVSFFEKAGFRLLMRGYWQPALADDKNQCKCFL